LEIEKRNEELEALRNNIASIATELTNEVASSKILSEQITALESELQQTIGAHQERINKYNIEFHQAQQDASTSQLEADKLTQKLEAYQEELAKTRKEAEEANIRRNELRNLISTQEAEFKAAIQNISQNIQDATTLREEIVTVIQSCQLELKIAEQDMLSRKEVRDSVTQLQLEFETVGAQNAETKFALTIELENLDTSINALELESSKQSLVSAALTK
jgi:chromosome segregation ATPase